MIHNYNRQKNPAKQVASDCNLRAPLCDGGVHVHNRLAVRVERKFAVWVEYRNGGNVDVCCYRIHNYQAAKEARYSSCLTPNL